ncbi:DUF4037 domain-containing protein [Actinoplanes sp. NPDC049802]|uniref:DUF4037 domain-containing protein n=1 Tax=Actinoplanes sp. NPDC049802 TaxID=3154742 RepID=UPI0033C472E6
MPPSFMPGLSLCRLFYLEAVRPLLDRAYPGLSHAAARIGPGSEVLGFDSERSVDHDWGPRLELFLSVEDVISHGADISALLAARLPKQICGWPTNFEPPGARVQVMAATTGPVAHRVHITDVTNWSAGQFGFDVRRGMSALDWLAIPAQRLAEATGGAVFHDDSGELTHLRSRLRWYPDEVWRYILAAQWTRIAQEEAFVGRSAEAGDDLGSRLVAARLAREVMRLCLLLARQYPPYSKWLGTAFAALPDIEVIVAALREAVGTGDAARRQAGLCTAYEVAGRWQNQLGLANPVEPTRRPYFDRPYPVIDAARFVTALLERVSDATLAALPPVGAVDQYVDSTDVLSQRDLPRYIMDAVSREPSDNDRF